MMRLCCAIFGACAGGAIGWHIAPFHIHYLVINNRISPNTGRMMSLVARPVYAATLGAIGFFVGSFVGQIIDHARL